MLAVVLWQGAVNLSIKTLYVPNRIAVVILLLYLAFLCSGVTAATMWKKGRSTTGTKGAVEQGKTK